MTKLTDEDRALLARLVKPYTAMHALVVNYPEEVAALLSAARDEGRAEGLGGWEPIETAPSDTPVIVITAEGRIFKAIYKPGVAENEQGSCGAWCTVEETDPHPACWTDGMCWASNEDGVPSDAPAGWLPAPPASQTQEG